MKMALLATGMALAFGAAIGGCGGTPPAPPPPRASAVATPGPTDLIEVSGDVGLDVVGLIDGLTEEGCVHDMIVRGHGVLSLGNLLPSTPDCKFEATLFQVDRAMYYKAGGNLTAATGDRVPVVLSEPLKTVDVVIRLTKGMSEDDRKRAINDLARANYLYNTMRCGIRFLLKAPVPKDGYANVRAVKTCHEAKKLNDDLHVEAGVVNVYYTPSIDQVSASGYEESDPRGLFCRDTKATVLIGNSADNETLAHELGHVLSLEHASDRGNIMVGGTPRRTRLTEGQCFRCNEDKGSFLKWRGQDIVLDRSCKRMANSPKCPQADRVSRFPS